MTTYQCKDGWLFGFLACVTAAAHILGARIRVMPCGRITHQRGAHGDWSMVNCGPMPMQDSMWHLSYRAAALGYMQALCNAATVLLIPAADCPCVAGISHVLPGLERVEQLTNKTWFPLREPSRSRLYKASEQFCSCLSIMPMGTHPQSACPPYPHT